MTRRVFLSNVEIVSDLNCGISILVSFIGVDDPTDPLVCCPLSLAEQQHVEWQSAAVEQSMRPELLGG
ncbi:hypothetical protein AA309_29845 [Microvirga vignae]|uniref:Uncharacterized protein n=1 Tax=Microvirga vignae TaxID=1225564 RepID=A0A0H1R4I1_9HYPH|nr:hypothetical protein AA309_29845 [Microvirga vignae]